nr:MAG TPA: hypothetical protein [Caudoviricetes sp.]
MLIYAEILAFKEPLKVTLLILLFIIIRIFTLFSYKFNI